MTIYLEYHDIIYIDATGLLIRKFMLPNGKLSPHVYLYQTITNTPKYRTSIPNVERRSKCKCDLILTK